jgi:flagellar motor switch protein FliG
MALKSAGRNVQDTVFRNMSKRAAAMLKEEIKFLKRASLKEIKDARKSIVSLVLRLAGGDESVPLLEDEDQERADEVKERLAMFDDIVMLDDMTVQKVMREVDAVELTRALKFSSQEVQDTVFRNMSERAAAMLKEEMEFMGQLPLKEVKKARLNIVSLILRLEDTGEILAFLTRDYTG